MLAGGSWVKRRGHNAKKSTRNAGNNRITFSSFATASAIDVKVKGTWQFHYGYATNPSLVDKGDTGRHADRFRARQRIRTQIEFIADENLSAMLNFETNMHWGDHAKGTGVNNTYGAIDADNSTFFIKHAYLNWTLPNTQVKTRMGMQGISMPSAVGGNPVLSADVAGISVSTQFTPELGMTFFWARPYDTTWGETGQTGGMNLYDEVDVFGIVLPIKTDVVRVSPWAAAALIGKDSFWYNADNKRNYTSMGKPTQARRDAEFDNQGYGWWLGSSFELPVLDPFFVKLDAMMGGLETGDSDYDAFGWYVAADIGYKFSWGSASVIGFYSSGDKDTDDYGQLPIISGDSGWNVTGSGGGFYGLGGAAWRRFDGYLSDSGQGLWGLGFKIADVSFVDNLKHTLLGMYYGGTNEGDSQSNQRSVRDDFTTNSRSLMTSDHAWEITLLNEYKVSQNLSLRYDLGYIQLELGDHWKNKGDTKGNVYTGIGVQYSF